jgi:hypothetical protein
MFGLSKKLLKKQSSARSTARRKGDEDERGPEASVLKALHIMARRSSPHKASTRANMARAISVVEASMLGLCHIEELINECLSLCNSARETDDKSKRALLAERYADIIDELNAIAESTGHGGHHLIGGNSRTFEVDLGEQARFKLKLPHINLTAGPRGLALPKPARAFESAASLAQFDRHLALVKDRLERSASIFREHGTDLSKRLALVLEGAYAEVHELTEDSPVSARPLAKTFHQF